MGPCSGSFPQTISDPTDWKLEPLPPWQHPPAPCSQALTSLIEVFQSPSPWQPGPPHRRRTREARESRGQGEERDKWDRTPVSRRPSWGSGTAPRPQSRAVPLTARFPSCTHLCLEAPTGSPPHPHPLPLLCAHSFQVFGWPEVASGWSAPEQGQGTLRMEPGQEGACRNSSPGRSRNAWQPKGILRPLLHSREYAHTYTHPHTHTHLPPSLWEFPSPAAYPDLHSGRHTTCKEAGGQELGRGV